jgi:hypothetical protein
MGIGTTGEGAGMTTTIKKMKRSSTTTTTMKTTERGAIRQG